MQEHGRIVPGDDVLKLRPIERDLSGLIHQVPFSQIVETLGIFDEAEFERALEHDIREATELVVIFSGYVTPRRVAKLGDLFRAKIAQGVAIRCVTRPPQTNGSIPPARGREALNMLEGIGVTGDCRANIHQKVCLVDNRIVWMGSLNALSHAGRADETMTRAVDEGYGAAVAAHMSRRPVSPSKAASAIAEAEESTLSALWRQDRLPRGKIGPYYKCENECGWSTSLRDQNRNTHATTRTDLPVEGPSCPICSSPTRLRTGEFGQFYGCVRYPKCPGTLDSSTSSQLPNTKPARKKRPSHRS